MINGTWQKVVVVLPAICAIAAVPVSGFGQRHDDRGGDRGRHGDDRGRKHGEDGARHRSDDKPGRHVREKRDRHREEVIRAQRSDLVRRRNDVERERRERELRRVRIEDRRRRDPYYLDDLSHRRQQTKNEWRNIAIVSGLVAALGLLQHDNRLVFAGSAGALYSLYRYEQDRKSQSRVDRLRASYFSRPYFYREGRRYDRRLVVVRKQKYYRFVRR